MSKQGNKKASKAKSKADGSAKRQPDARKNRGASSRPAAGFSKGMQSRERKPAATVCDKAARCGACSQVNVPYGQQLERKDAAMRKLFGGLLPDGQLDSVLMPIIGMEQPFYYRNKVISPFAPGRKGEILTGMYAAGTHRLVDTSGCVVENEKANRVVQAVRSIMKRHEMQPYNEDTCAGFVRHVVVRVAHNTDEMLVTIVTNGEEFESSRGFCRELVRRCPDVTTVVQNINTRSTNVILGEKERTLYGPGFILDKLCGLSFRISSHSFYQVNAVQTEVLYEQAVRAAALSGVETVIDAYCGTGTIGLVAAAGLVCEKEGNRLAGAARVIGVESVESAVRDARLNARHNGIENAEFVCADATDFMRQMASGCSIEGVEGADGGPLVLMMDPPRSGSTPEFLEAAASLAPERVVYISCNPATQVRDIRQLLDRGYALDRVQPVDMFPHTDHVETVAMLCLH